MYSNLVGILSFKCCTFFKKEEIYYHEDFNKRQICHETDAGSGIEQHRSAD